MARVLQSQVLMFECLFIPLLFVFIGVPVRFLSGLRATVCKQHLFLFISLPFTCFCILVSY